MSVDGMGTELDLSAMTSLDASFDDGTGFTNTHTIRATNSGEIDLSGLESLTTPDRSEDQMQFAAINGSIDLSSLTTIDGAGQAIFFSSSGGSISLGNADNSGVLLASDGGSITINGDYTQTGGTTGLDGGIIDITGAADIQGGSLVGVGTINATTLTNDSLINPGNQIGTLNLNGNYTQTADGTLNIQLGGTNIGEFDQLSVSDSANLNGTLNVSLFNGYTPQSGDSFDILTFGSRLGEFGNIIVPDGFSVMTQYEDNRVTLEFI
jgi:hypothetical protein